MDSWKLTYLSSWNFKCPRSDFLLSVYCWAIRYGIRGFDDFILLKEWHIACYMDIEKNILAIEATDRFISYLKDFPLQNHFEAASATFWPLLENLPTIHFQVPQEVQPVDSQVMDILQWLPHVMETSYFGPRSQMPRGHRICGSSNNVRGQGWRREGNVE